MSGKEGILLLMDTHQRAGRDLTPQMVTILTTEHYNMQNGRASTIADAGGRAGLFISAVSTTLVALAFIGQASNFGGAFYVFSLILFPTLYFLGLVTFERTLQSAIEDILYARGMSRLRHLFLEHAPELRPYFILSASDDAAATLERVGMKASLWQTVLGTAGTIGIITSVIGGTFFGLLLAALFALPLAVCVIVGAIIFLISDGFFLWYHWRKMQRVVGGTPVLFPGVRGEV
jgi:hypothetical protein